MPLLELTLDVLFRFELHRSSKNTCQLFIVTLDKMTDEVDSWRANQSHNFFFLLALKFSFVIHPYDVLSAYLQLSET